MVLYALLAVAVFAVVALVLDIAALRQGRRGDRSAADFAAAAGVSELEPVTPSTYAAACQAAWDYVVLNIDDADGAITPPNCAATFPATACDPAAPATATGTAGPLTVSITYPVPDADPLMRAELAGGDAPQAIDVARDGGPCQRLGVRIERERTFLFAGIIGTESGRTDVHAVARRVIQSGPDVPAVVALEPSGCDAVVATGAPLQITGAVGDPDSLLVDTDLSGCGSGFAIDGSLPGGVSAGEIEAYALSGPNALRTATGVVTPAPVGVTAPMGLGFLDVRYNCGAACAEPIGDLDALRADYGGPAPPAGLAASPAVPCTIPVGADVVESADVFVDCPVLRVEGRVTFTGTTAVTAGDVVITATGCVAVNDGACGAAVGVPRSSVTIYVRGNVVKEDQGKIVTTNTFLYANGFSAVAPAAPGSSELRMSAPQSGPFEDLLVWVDGAGDVVVGEQQVFSVEGTIAAPNARLVLAGTTAGAAPLRSQLVANRVATTGPEPIVVSPSAGRATGAVARQAKLIR